MEREKGEKEGQEGEIAETPEGQKKPTGGQETKKRRQPIEREEN